MTKTMDYPFRNLEQYFQPKLNFSVEPSLHDYEVPWECYRCPNSNLFYFIHSKCASRLHDELMHKLQWRHTDVSEINWDTDIVVSHIRDPLVKHRKGIVEAIVVYADILPNLTHPKMIELLANITSIDHHTYTIEQQLGANALKVRWIPIDTKLDHKPFTLEVFQAHGAVIPEDVRDWFLSSSAINQATEFDANLYKLISKFEVPSQIKRLIDFDTCLYNLITTPKEPEDFKSRVSQLVKSGMSEEQAINTADSEVFSGEFLNWRF